MQFNDKLAKALTEAIGNGQRVVGTVFTQPDVTLQIGDEQYTATIVYMCDAEYGTEPGEPRSYDHPGSPGGVVDIYPVEGTIDIDVIDELFGPDGEPMAPPTESDPEAWRMVLNAATQAFNPEWPNFIEAATQSAMEDQSGYDDHADQMYDRWKDSRF